ncbi:unnamed protein product [Symbiodinium sp. CCMP2592]|nr:unnamed protein product [Symbiodinium sp. CCMP2592]
MEPSGAAAPAQAKAANDQGGVGEFTFPPSPPPGVSDLAGDVPLPQVFPGCGESSEGSFSRVSFGSECVENDLHFPLLEFPEDWEDDAPEIATARTPMDLESVERSNREVASLMRDIFGSDDSHVENVESRTASASAAPCEQAASSIPDLDQAMSIAHADASADGISLAASGEFVSTAGVADDALGSFVGGLVKQDVARFGRLDDGLKLPWESEFSKLLFDPDCVWDPLQGRKQDSIFPPITHNAQAAHRPPAGPKEAPLGSIFAWAITLGAAARDPAAERERKREQGIGMWSRCSLLAGAWLLLTTVLDMSDSARQVDELLNTIDLTDVGGIEDQEACSVVPESDQNIPAAPSLDQEIPDNQLLSFLEDDEVWDGRSPSAPDPSCAAEISESEREWYLIAGSFGAAAAECAPSEPSPPNLEPEQTLAVPALDSIAEDQLQQSAVGHIHKRLRLEAPLLPWETQPLAAIFGGPSWHDTLQRRINLDLMPGVGSADVLKPAVPKVPAPKPQIVAASLANRLHRFRPEASDEDVRNLALAKLKVLITSDPLASELGKSLIDKLGGLVQEAVVAQSFADAFRAKASSTLNGHACALTRFSAWCARQAAEPLRVDEEQLYAYLCEMRSSNRGATSGNKFLHSLTFLEYSVGLIFLSTDVVVSARVRGVARDMALTKAPLSQRPPLTVEQAAALEALLVNDLNDTDACVLGQILFAVHSAGRWRDIQGLQSVDVSEGSETTLLLANGLKSKTTHTAEAQRRLLPYVAISTGVSGYDWGDRWLTARRNEGLQWGGDFCLPSFSLRLGRWSTARMGSGEASAYLRDFLEAVNLPNSKVGTHSLKTTLLTWASRSVRIDFSEPERLHLGHHSEGSFNPDLPPARRVEHLAEAIMVGSSQASNLGQHAPAGEDSASSDDSEAGIPEGHGGRQAADLVRGAFPDQFLQDIVVHRFSGISHVVKDSGMLWCHRPVSSNYTPLSEAGVAAEFPTACHQCSRALGLGDDPNDALPLEPGQRALACLDSSAYFLERLAKVGLSNELRDALARAGYTTFGALAFAVSSTPGAASDEAVSRWAQHLADPLPSEHQMSVLRRLLFEAQSMSIAEMRDRVNQAPGEAPTRKLPMIERAERLKALRRKLPGLILTPDTLPANRLVDNYVDQLDSGVLSYVKPDACISRAQEMDSNKRDPTLQVQGNELKLAAKQVELRCSISTDMQLRQAWTRRSLAMELAQLASYTVLETWVQSLFSRMQREPPAGYHSVSLSQVMAADRELFQLLSHNLMGQIQASAGAARPLDLEIESLSKSTDVLVHLLPLVKPPPMPHPTKRPHPGAASPNPILAEGLSGPEPQDAESFALNLLAKAEIPASSVAQLSFLLPCDSSVRPSSGPNAFLFSCGAYVHGGVTGTFANTRTLPACTQLLARFAKQFVGDSFPFTSLVLLRDNLTHMHRDRNNTGLSALIRCSDFEGGGLWVADPKGSSPMQFEGKVHQGSTRELDRCLYFDPRLLHCTLPWSEGPRIVLAAYSVRDACILPQADADLLLKLGFVRGPGKVEVPSTVDLQPNTQASPSGLGPACSLPLGVGEPTSPSPAKLDPPAKRPLFIELFAGSAGLSRAMLDFGFEVVTFDHYVNHPKAPVCKLDLATASGQSVVWDLLQARVPFAVHLAPPILAGHEALLVFCCDVVGWCTQHDVVVSLEQPDRSESWALLTSMARSRLPAAGLSKWAGLQKIVYPLCMHGGSSRALTRLLCTARVFDTLAVACDGKHWHGPRPGPWAAPAAYPPVLCHRLAGCLLQCAKARNTAPGPLSRIKEASTAAVGRQTKRHAPLVPEYRAFRVVPSGSKLQPSERILSAKCAGGSTEDGPEISGKQWKLGILHSPPEFLNKALSCPHPLDAARPLSKHFLDALKAVMTTPPKVLELKRKLAIAKAEILVKKLSCSEKTRHNALPDHMKKVLESKNLSLFEALLKEHAYWDMGVVQLMEQGVDLVGFQDTPSCYPQKIAPATMSRDEFLDSAEWRRRALTTPGARAPDAGQLAHLEQTCKEEVDLGFMLGPYTEDQVSRLFGHTRWSCIRRFVLEQKPGKLRPIDDAKEALVNSASTSTMRLELEDADYLSAMALEVARRILADPSKPGAVPWVARCLDLTKAYKQMCVSERDLPVSVVFFLDGQGKPRYYVSHSLLFGCTSSVFAFNRVSKAISFLLNQMLLVPSSVFYDDFPLLSPNNTSDSATWATTALLDLLGWGHARVGKDAKGVPFAASFEVLGMSMQLDGVHRGRLTLQNKAGRIEQLVALFQGFLDRGAITVHEAQVAHGLLNFSAGYVNGRALRLTCQELLRLTKASSPASSKAIRSFCVNSIEALRALSPRVLSVWDSRAPIHIFTDGAWEQRRAGIGAVIFDTASGKSWTYEGLVPEPLILRWEAEVGTQLICQIELYAVVCLRWALASTLDHRRLIWWIDNESARYGLIKGISDSPSMSSLIQSFAIADSKAPSYSWYERVPSFSNIADGPSRGDSSEALAVCTDKVGNDYPLDQSLTRRLLSS